LGIVRGSFPRTRATVANRSRFNRERGQKMRLIDAERDAYWRGCRMADGDRRVPGAWPRVSPFSGEWAGESVPELLGDLIAGVMRGEGLPSGWEEWDVTDALCDAFVQGYELRFPDVVSSIHTVCSDCFYVLHNGINEDVTECVDRDETRERPAGVFPFPIAYVSDAHDYGRHAEASFSWRACECCGSTLGGDRYDVNVWEAERRCEWFALCDNVATGERKHPILGNVPVCDRCHAFADA